MASQQTCCCSWRRSRAAPECRCYPSLPPRAGSGLWPHTDPGRWLISSQLEVKGCQSQGAAPRQQGEKKPAARLAVLGDVYTCSKYLVLNKVAPALFYRSGPSSHTRAGSFYSTSSGRHSSQGRCHCGAIFPPRGSCRTLSLGDSSTSSVYHSAEELISW